MNRSFPRPLLILLLAIALCLGVSPAVRAVDAGAPARAQSPESAAFAVETLFQQLLEANAVKPIFAELGGGFYSMSATLPPAAIEQLADAASVDVDPAAKASTLQVLAVGQQLTAPTNPSTLIHAALSNVSFPYNYWVIVLNLGAQSVTRSTTIALTGPKKFSKSVSIAYGASSIWVIWYNPAVGIGTQGVYTLKGTVDGAGSATTKSYSVP